MSRSDRTLLSLLGDADLCSAKNPPALFFLNEDHDPQILSLPFFLQRNIRIASEGSFAVTLRFADLAHGAHNRGMVKVFPAVFPPPHRPVQTRFRNGQPDFR